MKTINKDITTVTKGIVCHQCNCQGVMGAGVAKAIRKKWPAVWTHYNNAYRQNLIWLGQAQVVQVDEELYVCNIMGRDRFGTNQVHTDYKAVENAFRRLHWWLKPKMFPIKIYFPYGMGCGLAGGNWKYYSALIELHFPDAIICKLEK